MFPFKLLRKINCEILVTDNPGLVDKPVRLSGC